MSDKHNKQSENINKSNNPKDIILKEKKRFFVTGLISSSITASVCIMMIYVSISYYSNTYEHITRNGSQYIEKEYTVTQETSISDIATVLDEDGIILLKPAFMVNVIKDGYKNYVVSPGQYQLNTDMSFNEMMSEFKSGEDVIKLKENEVLVTIKPTFTINNLAELMENKEVCTSEAFLQALNNPHNYNFVNEIPEREDKLQGYFPTGDFIFDKNMNADDVVNHLLTRYQSIYDEYVSQIGDYTYDEVIIMASIIAKEVRSSDYKADYASYMINRLNNNMPIEAKAPLSFYYNVKMENLTSSQMEENNPYNTFVNAGLPPSPIGLPSTSDIEAVLSPTDSNYLYYDHNDDGYFFAETEEELKQKIDEASTISEE